MMKKIFEKKFLNDADATAHLEKTGWNYSGQYGIFVKYHLYKGVEIDRFGVLQQIYELRLKKDGHVELYSDFSIGKVYSTTNLPRHVWSSKDIFDFIMQETSELNSKLINELGMHYDVEWNYKECEFSIYSLVNFDHPKAFAGSKVRNGKVAGFKNFASARDWVIAESKKCINN